MTPSASWSGDAPPPAPDDHALVAHQLVRRGVGGGVSTASHGTLRAARSTSALRSASTSSVGTPADAEPAQPRPSAPWSSRSPRPSRSTTASSPAATFAARRGAQRDPAHLRWASPCRTSAACGPNGLPPPFHWVARIEPWRARPVPFWRHGFLPPPRHLAAALGVVGARAPVGQLAHDRLVEHRHVHGPAEHLGGELEGAAGLAAASRTGTLGMATSPPAPSAAAPWSASRSSAPSRSRPRAPGTAPRSRMRFCSGITRTTGRLSTVRRSPPMRPGSVMARPHARGVGRGADRARAPDGTSIRGWRRRRTSRGA